ncbi:MAG: LOG family protein [Candidatus Portnoybacteria bacterium]|nr:LOG family protein [Candidatus Portnoybacteria bacterium]
MFAHSIKPKICVSGPAKVEHCSADACAKAEEVGRLIAKHGAVIVTGATIGIPWLAAKGAKEAGGLSIGLSPAASEKEHVKVYNLPTDYFDLIIYTGFNYSGRNLLLVRSSDASIIICGRMGTLNEFTIAFEDGKPIGILSGSGGTLELIDEIIEESHRSDPGGVIYDSEPETLVKKVLDRVEELKNY